jgi:hypothetical protein
LNTHNTNKEKKYLIELINLYIKNTLYFSKKLSECLGIKNICNRRYLRENNIALIGACKKNNLNYTFHGSGCLISTPDIEIEIEFNEKCTLDRFDIWRLWCFVSDNELKSHLNIFRDKKVLEDVFFNLDEIEKDGDLFFLKALDQ